MSSDKIKKIWLYGSDYSSGNKFMKECYKWHKEGYEVFMVGYSSTDVKKFSESYKGYIERSNNEKVV